MPICVQIDVTGDMQMRMNPNCLLSCNNHTYNYIKFVIFQVVVSNIGAFVTGSPLCKGPKCRQQAYYL